MPLFFVKKEFFDKLARGEKRVEIRVGDDWKKLAEGIIAGKIKPTAIFKSGKRTLVMEIYRVEIHRNLKAALGNGRWKLLGLDAKTFHEAVLEVRKLYRRGAQGPTVLFWLRKPREKHKGLN